MLLCSQPIVLQESAKDEQPRADQGSASFPAYDIHHHGAEHPLFKFTGLHYPSSEIDQASEPRSDTHSHSERSTEPQSSFSQQQMTPSMFPSYPTSETIPSPPRRIMSKRKPHSNQQRESSDAQPDHNAAEVLVKLTGQSACTKHSGQEDTTSHQHVNMANASTQRSQ